MRLKSFSVLFFFKFSDQVFPILILARLLLRKFVSTAKKKTLPGSFSSFWPTALDTVIIHTFQNDFFAHSKWKSFKDSPQHFFPHMQLMKL